MADAKKCDICHKYYDHYKNVTINDNTLNGCRIKIVSDDSVGNCCYAFDLCEECMTKVHTLLIDISEKAMERDRK
jgi:hypothetical protein